VLILPELDNHHFLVHSCCFRLYCIIKIKIKQVAHLVIARTLMASFKQGTVALNKFPKIELSENKGLRV